MSKAFKSLVVVNMLAGPGAGKTTLALATCAALKRLGVNCELVTEVAKDFIYAQDFDTLQNQPYITTCQFHELYRLTEQVDVVVSDGSLLLGAVYSKEWVPEPFYACIQGLYELFDNLNFWVQRPAANTYSEVGRVANAEQAAATDAVIQAMMRDWGVRALEVQSGDYVLVVSTVMQHLERVKRLA